MTSHPTRRRVLQLTGVGATASLAGCSQFDIADSSEDELEADREPDIDLEDGITAIVQPSQEALAEVEQEIMTELEEGDLDQQEAQQEFQERQGELFMSRAVALESEIEDDDDLTVEAGVGEQGALLLEGTNERLMEMLRNGDVDALLPGEQYGEVLAAQEQPAGEPQPEPQPDPEEEPDSEDDSGTEDDDSDGDDDSDTEDDDSAE